MKINKYNGERLDYSSVLEDEFAHHIARYDFCKQFVKEKKVLDAACGVGYGSYYLKKFGRASIVYGIDINKECIFEAKKYFSTNIKNIIYINSNVEKTPFNEMQFDVIVSLETFEHVINIENYLKEMRRILKKGGKFIVSTPNKKFYTDAGILNRYHINEMYKDEFESSLLKFFDIEALYYQLCPFIKIKNNYPSLLNFVKKNLKIFIPSAKYFKRKIDLLRYIYKIKQHGIKNNYGKEFEKFIDNKKDLLYLYRILEVKHYSNIYNEKMGNFLAICSLPERGNYQIGHSKNT